MIRDWFPSNQLSTGLAMMMLAGLAIPSAAQVSPISKRALVGDVLIESHSARRVVVAIDTSRPLDGRADFLVHFTSGGPLPQSLEFRGLARVMRDQYELTVEALDGTRQLLLSLRGTSAPDSKSGLTQVGDGIELVFERRAAGLPMGQVVGEAAQRQSAREAPTVRHAQGSLFQKDPEPDGEGGCAEDCSIVCKDGNGCEVTCPDGWCAKCSCPASCTCKPLEL